jgi:hypothetical protein
MSAYCLPNRTISEHPEVLSWVEEDSDAYREALSAEEREKGSGTAVLLAAYRNEKLTCPQQS